MPSLVPLSVPRRLKMVHSSRFPKPIRFQSDCPIDLLLFRYVFDHFPIFKRSIQPALKWFTRFKNPTPKSLLFVHFHRIHLKHFEDIEILPYLVYPCVNSIVSDRFWSKVFHFSCFFFLFSCFLFLGFPKFSCFPYHNESMKFLQRSGGERRKSKASIHVVWKCWSKVFAPKSAPFSLPLSCSCGVVRLWFSLISNPEPFIARLFDYWTLLTVVGRVDEFTNADYETCCRLSSWSVELISEDYGTCWKLSEGRRRDQCRPMKTMEPVVDRRKDLQEQSSSTKWFGSIPFWVVGGYLLSSG